MNPPEQRCASGGSGQINLRFTPFFHNYTYRQQYGKNYDYYQHDRFYSLERKCLLFGFFFDLVFLDQIVWGKHLFHQFAVCSEKLVAHIILNRYFAQIQFYLLFPPGIKKRYAPEHVIVFADDKNALHGFIG